MIKHEYISNYDLGFVNEDTVIIEVGTGPYGEASSVFFANLSKKTGASFHTIDINPDMINTLKHFMPEDLDYTFYNTDGESFFANYPLEKQISVLYLDNYDWIYKGQEGTKYIKEQLDRYKTVYNIEMNNISSTIAHLRQLLNAYKHLNTQCIIAIDDTWYDETLGTYMGKGSACVYYLLAHGWSIDDKGATQILYRGIE